MIELVIKACGPRTSLQDSGRMGAQRYGVSNSGAMDRLALAAANALVGNGPGMAAIEFMLLGGAILVEGGPARVAVAGAHCALTLDDHSVPPSTTIMLHPGQTLIIGPMQAGVYAYLAVEGGFDWPAQLGSLSLHQRAALGGFHGRPFHPEDRIPLHRASLLDGPLLALDPVALDADAPIRAVLGPQDDYFTASGREAFACETYAVSPEADRMGYRLSGPPIEHSRGFNIVSDGIVSGSVQVPGSGQPIVMMADRQTTGGYPKIATVISADLRILAQRRPGDSVRFHVIGMVEAQRIARASAELIGALPSRARSWRDGLPPLEELLALNLAGSAVNALSPDTGA